MGRGRRCGIDSDFILTTGELSQDLASERANHRRDSQSGLRFRNGIRRRQVAALRTPETLGSEWNRYPPLYEKLKEGRRNITMDGTVDESCITYHRMFVDGHIIHHFRLISQF